LNSFRASKFNLKVSLPSVYFLTLGKEALCRVLFLTLGKEAFAECFSLTLGKELLCRVPENKHSAKYLTLGKDADSGSDRHK